MCKPLPGSAPVRVAHTTDTSRRISKTIISGADQTAGLREFTSSLNGISERLLFVIFPSHYDQLNPSIILSILDAVSARRA
jgi:hypothetical protein